MSEALAYLLAGNVCKHSQRNPRSGSGVIGKSPKPHAGTVCKCVLLNREKRGEAPLEERVHKVLGVEGLQIVNALAHADVPHGHIQLLTDRQRDAALGRAI